MLGTLLRKRNIYFRGKVVETKRPKKKNIGIHNYKMHFHQTPPVCNFHISKGQKLLILSSYLSFRYRVLLLFVHISSICYCFCFSSLLLYDVRQGMCSGALAKGNNLEYKFFLPSPATKCDPHIVLNEHSYYKYFT